MSDKLTIINLESKIQELKFELRLSDRSLFREQFERKKLQEQIEAFMLLYPEEYSLVLEQLRKKKKTFCGRKRNDL